jgi:hypothetical protein
MRITEFESASSTIIWKTILFIFLSQRLRTVASLMESSSKDTKSKIPQKGENTTGEIYTLEWSSRFMEDVSKL